MRHQYTSDVGQMAERMLTGIQHLRLAEAVALTPGATNHEPDPDPPDYSELDRKIAAVIKADIVTHTGTVLDMRSEVLPLAQAVRILTYDYIVSRLR